MTLEELKKGNECLEKIAELEKSKSQIEDGMCFRATGHNVPEFAKKAGVEAMLATLECEIDHLKDELGEI